jgi:hypothetical protein
MSEAFLEIWNAPHPRAAWQCIGRNMTPQRPKLSAQLFGHGWGISQDAKICNNRGSKGGIARCCRIRISLHKFLDQKNTLLIRRAFENDGESFHSLRSV